ncbi:MAG: YbhB/YbcL family Raf kinase inhibitor-like protein [Euryarchaeota archaeon]|nr:YbhB/YbcL family Raf kinase inhibitor-like protein [Euryarchaeota archaeon]
MRLGGLLLVVVAVAGCTGAPAKATLRVELGFTEFPAEYTCDGADVSPEVRVEGAEEAAALAIIVDDPDAPRGTFTHWIAWNLPPSSIPGVPKQKVVESPVRALQGVNDFGRVGYSGPCPPPGKPHRYFFRVYALDAPLELEAGATRAELERAMKGHVIAYGEAVAKYGRV